MADLIKKTDTLNQGREKLNEAITDAETAKVKSESADVKATQALAKSESTQTQLDTIVIDGDSSVEAAQARVDAEGTAYGTLKERLDSEHQDVSAQLAETETKVDAISDGSFVNKKDLARLHSYREENKPIKLAILDDSTGAGVGWRFDASATGYGEMGDIDKPSSPEQFFLNFLMSSPYFIKPSKGLGGHPYFNPKGSTASAATSSNWDRYTCVFTAGNTPRLSLSFKHFPVKRNKLTVFYLARTADGAGKADIIVNGVTTTFDTYVPPVVYNGVTIPQQGFRLASVEVAIPTNTDTFDVLINNFRKGGSPTAVDGTVTIVGFYYGEPILLKNLAIRATTLTNNSTRNQGKGITTDERFQKAFDFGANVFYIGWGINDKTDGVSAQTFGNMLRQRIDEIRVFNPHAIIILRSVYSTGTTPYVVDARDIFKEVKKVALEKSCSFIDGDGILRQYNFNEVINDYVHQNEYGYKVVGNAMSELLSTPKSSEVISKSNNQLLINDYNAPVEVQAINGQSNITGNEVVVLTANVNLKNDPTVQILSKLALESDSLFTDTRFRLRVEKFAMPNQEISIGSEIVDASRFESAKRGNVFLLSTSKYSNAASLKIEVLGMNYVLSPTAGWSSKLAVTFH